MAKLERILGSTFEVVGTSDRSERSFRLGSMVCDPGGYSRGRLLGPSAGDPHGGRAYHGQRGLPHPRRRDTQRSGQTYPAAAYAGRGHRGPLRLHGNVEAGARSPLGSPHGRRTDRVHRIVQELSLRPLCRKNRRLLRRTGRLPLRTDRRNLCRGADRTEIEQNRNPDGLPSAPERRSLACLRHRRGRGQSGQKLPQPVRQDHPLRLLPGARPPAARTHHRRGEEKESIPLTEPMAAKRWHGPRHTQHDERGRLPCEWLRSSSFILPRSA